jgi:hypothetical protein
MEFAPMLWQYGIPLFIILLLGESEKPKLEKRMNVAIIKFFINNLFGRVKAKIIYISFFY